MAFWRKRFNSNEALSQAYSRSPETQTKAVNAGIKAMQLDPGQSHYQINLAYLLLNNRRYAEARIMAKRILAVATSTGEKEVANNLMQQVQQAEEWAARKPNAASTSQNDGSSPNSTPVTVLAGSAGPNTSSDAPVALKKQLYGVEGSISAVECDKKPEVTLNVDLPSGRPVTFYTSDFAKVGLSWAEGVSEPNLSTCAEWKGRHVKLWFFATPGKEYAGEISKIYFF